MVSAVGDTKKTKQEVKYLNKNNDTLTICMDNMIIIISKSVQHKQYNIL